MGMSPQSSVSVETEANGFLFLPSFHPDVPSIDIFTSLGTVEKLDGLNEIQELTPRSATKSPPNIYSGNFGFREFPFHTDLAHWYRPPRFLVLRCIRGAKNVKTRLFDSRNIVQAIGNDNLRRALVQPRRQIGNKRCLLRILEQESFKTSIFRWDGLFIAPATENSTRTYLAIQRKLAEMKPTDFVLKNPGDTLVLDNWRMLHGRSGVARDQRHRRIHRAYLSSLL